MRKRKFPVHPILAVVLSSMTLGLLAARNLYKAAHGRPLRHVVVPPTATTQPVIRVWYLKLPPGAEGDCFVAQLDGTHVQATGMSAGEAIERLKTIEPACENAEVKPVEPFLGPR
jgi:hypothetical protein